MFGIGWRDILGLSLSIVAGTAVFMLAGPDLGARILWGGLTLSAGVVLVMLRLPPDMVPLEMALYRRIRAARRPRRYVYQAPAPEPPPPAPAPASSPAPPSRPAPPPGFAVPALRLGPVRLLVPAEALFWVTALTGLIWSALSLLSYRIH